MKSIRAFPYKKVGIAIITCLMALLFVTNFAQAAGKIDPKANIIQWGDSYWTIANDGELVYADGNIGKAPALHDVLEANGLKEDVVKSIEIDGKTSASDIGGMFSRLPDLQSVKGMGNLNYSGDAEEMFRDDPSLQSIDLNNFDTSQITKMNYMFLNAPVKNLDLSNFNTSKVTAMSGMFDGTGNLKTLDLSNFDTRQVKDMSYLFYNSGISDVNLSSFDTSNVTSMLEMFLGAKNLTSLNLDNFDTTNVTEMSGMFRGTSNLKTLDVSTFDTSKVATFWYMFLDSGIDSLDLSSFTIDKNVQTTKMLGGTKNLKQLTLGKKTALKSDMEIPDVPNTDGYTGHWQNVGSGNIDNPTGNHIWTSSELMSQFDAPTMGNDTFVWKKMDPSNIHTGNMTDYKSDPVLSKYVSTAVDPLHPYRYNVVLNNDYNFFIKLEDGQSEKDHNANLGNKTGATVYSQAEMPVTYTGGARDGQKSKFIKVSFDGSQWYWIDQRALNLDLKSRYPAVNSDGIALIDDQFLGSTNTYGVTSGDFNSQMIDNAYNPDGQIIYQSFAKESDFANEKDPAQALKAFNDNLDRAAQNWNDVLGKTVLIKATDTDKKVTLKVVANPQGAGSATLSGNTGIDASIVKWGLDPNDVWYKTNVLFLTMRHELGHSLGLNHTSSGQYYGMPDGYQFSIDDDVMSAILRYYYDDGEPINQRTVTPEDVSAIKLIIANHNFENPQPQTKKVVTTKQIDRAVPKE